MVQDPYSTENRSINCSTGVIEFSMKRWKIIVAVVVTILVGVGAYVAHRAVDATRNAYAQEWVGGMVVEYLRQSDGRWPKSWEDLRPVYEQHVEQVGSRPWTFEDLRSRVVVRWEVDVDRLRMASSADDRPLFPVIHLRDGANSHWSGTEPNEMVWRYINRPDCYQVYSDLLRAEFGRSGLQRIVVTPETFNYANIVDENLKKDLSGVTDDTIEDFLAENRTPLTLSDRFSKGLNVVLVGRQRLEEAFSAKPGNRWEEFYRVFPESQGITSLSRVGFSRDRKQALVYIGTQSHSLAGNGNLVLLTWDGKNWQVSREVNMWVDREYNLERFSEGVASHGDLWTVEIHYDQIAPYYSGIDFNPQQRVAFAAELWDDAEEPVNPQGALQALPIAESMNRLSVLPAIVRTPVVVRV